MKSILITGGTGFLGKALAKRLVSIVDRVCIFSRGEYPQALMRKEIQDPELRMRWFIGDVRDQDRLRRAMEGVDTVIHAAALKRVEVGEYNPSEMVRTNVLGAINVINAAQDSDVSRVVMISTDKACAPLNAYGATKLTAEKLMLAANNTRGAAGPIFSVCRYGNVAGSTGSVIPTWRAHIRLMENTLTTAAQKIQVPVTDPTCTRFWMTIDEAVDIVLWTAENMQGGELVVPTLSAYRLGDLAEAMNLKPYITGLGQGEKKDEMMISPHETAGFRYVAPYLVKGGLADTHPEAAGIEGIKTGILTVEQLRARLKEVR